MSNIVEKGSLGFPAVSGDLAWWQSNVCYQIYPRSFQDSTGNGVGDLKGIIRRLDYLKDLGVGIVWLSPFYKSPMKDHGYDISDFKDVDPTFGNLDDFDQLLKEVHARGFKMILDYVPNHTSDQHRWFVESRKGGENNPYKDFYVWHDGKVDKDGVRTPPNNWISIFGGSAWEWDDTRRQYYFHQFVKEQPDLNWRNPAVKKEMEDVFRFWLDRGADGFRIDAIATLFEREDLADELPSGEKKATPEMHSFLLHHNTLNQQETYDTVQEWRNFFMSYEKEKGRDHIFMMVEVYDKTLTHSTKFYDYGVDFPFNFNLCEVEKSSTGRDVYLIVDSWLRRVPSGRWPNWVTGNHDTMRVSGRKGKEFVDAFNTLLLLLPGTPTTYQGEELGMLNVDVPLELVQDPWAKYFQKPEISRDKCRTPMQWSSEINADFTTAKEPWLPLHDQYKQHNVQTQLGDENSNLSFYRKLTQLRKEDSFAKGELRYVVVNDNIFSFSRQYKGCAPYLIMMNLGQKESSDDYRVSEGCELNSGIVVISSKGVSDKYKPGNAVDLSNICLKPSDTVVIKVIL